MIKNMYDFLTSQKVKTAMVLIAASVIIGLFSTTNPMLALGLIVSAALLLLFIVRPQMPYYAMIVLFNFAYVYVIIKQKDFNFYFTLSEFFIIIMFFLWFFSRSGKIAPPYPGTVCDIPLLSFWGVAALSVLWNGDLTIGLTHTVLLLFCILVTFVVALSVINSHAKFDTVIRLVIILGVWNSLICFFSTYSYPKYRGLELFENDIIKSILAFNDEGVGKRGHAFVHPLLTAFYLNFALMLSFGKLITTGGKKKKVAIGVMMVLMLTAHMTTLSKAPLLALIVGATFIFYHLRPLRKVFVLTLTIFLSIIVLSFMLANITKLKDSIRYTTNQITGYDENSSTTYRLALWKTAIKKGLEKHGLGVGIGALPRYFKLPAPHSHNSFIGAFGELGFAGFTLFLTVYLLAFKSYFEAFRQSRSEYYRRILLVYIGGYISLVITTFYSFNYTLDSAWWYVGLGFALVRLAKESPSDYRAGNLPFYKDGKTICAV